MKIDDHSFELKNYKIQLVESFSNVLGKYLSTSLISKITNLISIDYYYRLKETPDFSQHKMQCIKNLEEYLIEKVVNKDDFAQAMTLFIIAIKGNHKDADDEERILYKSSHIVVNSIINSYYKDIEKELIPYIYQAVCELIAELGPRQALEYIKNNPIALENRVMGERKMSQQEKSYQNKLISNNRSNSLLSRIYKGIKGITNNITTLGRKNLLKPSLPLNNKLIDNKLDNHSFNKNQKNALPSSVIKSTKNIKIPTIKRDITETLATGKEGPSIQKLKKSRIKSSKTEKSFFNH